MADQSTDTVQTGGTTGTAGSSAHGAQHLEHNSGGPVSWIGVTIAIIGSIIGGVAFVPQLHWWLFWVGAGVTLLGLIVIGGARTLSRDWY